MWVGASVTQLLKFSLFFIPLVFFSGLFLTFSSGIMMLYQKLIKSSVALSI